MPSGAKKRKAAKKKLQKKAHNFTNHKGSHSNSQGSEDPKSHDERVNDGVVVEREENVEGGGVKVTVHSDDVAKESQNGNNKSSSSNSSGSSSSSDDDEVVVEKEKSAKSELGKVEASVENAGVSEVVNEAVEENIPKEETVKQVVSLPQVSTIVSETVAVDNSLTSDVIKSDLKQNVDEFLRPFDEKIEVASGMEKIGEKVIAALDGGSENTSEPVSVAARDDEGLLPQSSGVKAVEECYAGGDGKVSETQKYMEEQPLLPSAPVLVRRTSWMDCCGLFEVFSGRSSR